MRIPTIIRRRKKILSKVARLRWRCDKHNAGRRFRKPITAVHHTISSNSAHSLILLGHHELREHLYRAAQVIPTPLLSTCPLHTISGCGKERRTPVAPVAQRFGREFDPGKRDFSNKNKIK